MVDVMGSKTVVIRQNADHTITVRVGRAVEHISTANMEHGKIFDAVKWAIISKGLYLSDAEIAEILYDERQNWK